MEQLPYVSNIFWAGMQQCAAEFFQNLLQKLDDDQCTIPIQNKGFYQRVVPIYFTKWSDVLCMWLCEQDQLQRNYAFIASDKSELIIRTK